MDRLSRVPIFVAVAKHGSFAEAARRLGMTGSAVSKQVQRLEADLGVRLFHRTTRQLSLTDEGSYLFERSAPLVEGLEEVGELLAGRKAKPEGMLRISAPVALSQRLLKEPLSEFATRYPEIGLHLELSDRFVDLVAEGFDLALRIGHLEDSSLIARRIADVPLAVVASPALVSRYGMPEIPQDITKMPYIHYVSESGRSRLTLQRDQGDPETIICQGRISSNNDQMMLAFALAGLGVITLPRFMIEQEIARGELLVVLPTHRVVPIRRLYAVFPNSRHLPLKTRVLIDFLVSTIVL